jgi:nitrate/TMAO reductase-like tetraheme cytochrome c subunit
MGINRELGAVLAALVLAASPARAQETVAEEIETCLSCHSDQQLSLTFKDGGSRPLFVDGQALSRSVHGGALRCTDCHPGMQEVPHPERTFRDAGDFQASFAETCKRCHFDKYTKLADGVHYRLLPKGEAPTCIDCHGAHDVSPPGHPRRRVSETCSTCHADVGEAYAASVHGKALAAGKAQDVPVCTDCHRSHDVAGPHDESWLVRTPQMCGNCHADEKRMKKYGLSTAVLRTYLADFHGMTASLSHTADKGDQRVTALCSDCHGVHGITRPDDPVSGVRANLVVTCRKCHSGADEKFPSAWLSHYEPSWKKAPLVHAVRLFYRVLIPFMIGGLGLQVLLHLWRAVVSR